MAVEVRYVVTHKGEEKLVTTDKKEADQYDKMLEVGENLADYIKAKGIVIEDSVLEELGIMLSSNKTDVLALLKGKTVEDVLGTETDDPADPPPRRLPIVADLVGLPTSCPATWPGHARSQPASRACCPRRRPC